MVGQENDSYTEYPILRSIEQIGDSDSFILSSPKITVLDEGTNFTLSA